jgi:hypothetical protein
LRLAVAREGDVVGCLGCRAGQAHVAHPAEFARRIDQPAKHALLRQVDALGEQQVGGPGGLQILRKDQLAKLLQCGDVKLANRRPFRRQSHRCLQRGGCNRQPQRSDRHVRHLDLLAQT